MAASAGAMAAMQPQQQQAEPVAAPKRSAIPEWLKAEIVKKQQSAAAGAYVVCGCNMSVYACVSLYMCVNACFCARVQRSKLLSLCKPVT
jgi:hypothetical protein